MDVDQVMLENPSSLTDWYLSVRDIPFDQLSVEDLCRAVRQDLFVEKLLPVIVDHLEQDVFMGYMYDGEMLSALVGMNVGFWRRNCDFAHRILNILSNTQESDDQNLKLVDVPKLKMALKGIFEKK
ncbi:MAG: hypothetical protein LBI92_02530 [Azoarcus sp.]|nr:hypothetical protein [Azoarcus sp.]